MHTLHVEYLGDEEYDRIIVHEEDCPTEVRWIMPSGEEIREYVCGVGEWANWYGHEDLKDDLRYVTEGDHPIDFYSYTPKSWFEDAEAYLYYVEDPPE